MPIQPGVYTIHRDKTDVKDNFATAIALNTPICGLPLGGGIPSDIQTWEVRLRDHDTYSIEKPQYIPGPPGAFGADEIRPGAAVEYKREPATWVITALDEERFAYSIHLVGAPIGSIYAIDLKPRDRIEYWMVLESFPITAESPSLPGWIFTPVHKN